MTSGYKRSLHQKIDRPDPLGFFLENANEFVSDQLAFLFRIADARQHVQKTLRRIDAANIQVQIVLKHRKNFFELVLPQQAGVDENADRAGRRSRATPMSPQPSSPRRR